MYVQINCVSQHVGFKKRKLKRCINLYNGQYDVESET